jgi:hypothetical protein
MPDFLSGRRVSWPEFIYMLVAAGRLKIFKHSIKTAVPNKFL